MNYYLGVDIGTSSVKSLLMDATGNIAGTSQIGYDIIKSSLKYAEQNMEELWEATKRTVSYTHLLFSQDGWRLIQNLSSLMSRPEVLTSAQSMRSIN